jgi:hypothetical protein
MSIAETEAAATRDKPDIAACPRWAKGLNRSRDRALRQQGVPNTIAGRAPCLEDEGRGQVQTG